MNNKSEELAKLMGIAPKRSYYIGRLVNNCWNSHSITQRKEIVKTYATATDRKFKVCKVETVYPDFTKPSNFVRLLEIASKASSITFSWNGSRYGCGVHFFVHKTFLAPTDNIQKSFIEGLIWAIQKNTCKNPSLLDGLQQQAQQAEWEY